MSQDIEYMRAWRKANPDKMRAYRKKHYYTKRVVPKSGCGRIISEEAKKRGYKHGEYGKSTRRFDPLVNWGFSKGRHKCGMVHFHV